MIDEMPQTTNQYANAEEANQCHRKEVTRVPWTEHPERCNDDRREDRRNDNRDRHYDIANATLTIVTIATY